MESSKKLKDPVTKSNKNTLCIDLLNYTRDFAKGENHWEKVYNAIKNVERFIKSCKYSGFSLEVFVDGRHISEESVKKWEYRRQKEVEDSKRDTPHGINLIMGDIFTKYGVKVHSSIEADNDDTIASFANHYKGIVLSRDRDFLRYNNRKYVIYTHFHYDGDYIYFTKQHHKYPKQGVEMRDIIFPLPKTSRNFSDVLLIKNNEEEFFYIRGAPSPIIKYMGNPHVDILPLRQALYFKLGIKGKIKEKYPNWDFTEEKFIWTEFVTEASDEYLSLLEHPEKAVNYFFPKLDKPNKVKKCDWLSHLFTIHAIIYELCCSANNSSFLESIMSCNEFSKYENTNFGDESQKKKKNTFFSEEDYLFQKALKK